MCRTSAISRRTTIIALVGAMVWAATATASDPSLSAAVTSAHAKVTTRICGARRLADVVPAGRSFRVTGRLTTSTHVTLFPLRAVITSCPGGHLVEFRSVPINAKDGSFRATFTLLQRGDYRLVLTFSGGSNEARAHIFLRAG